jgi:hypothetical protein
LSIISQIISPQYRHLLPPNFLSEIITLSPERHRIFIRPRGRIDHPLVRRGRHDGKSTGWSGAVWHGCERDQCYRKIKCKKFSQFPLYVSQGKIILGPNPTITSYNASVVKIYNATNSIARF